MRKVSGILIGCTLLAASPAAGQDRAWPHRIFVTIDLPSQTLNNDFWESVSFPDALRRNENVTFAADYESMRGTLFDAGAAVRVAQNLGSG